MHRCNYYCNDDMSSLRKVAERSQLSVRTVSYILNGGRAASFQPATRERVERAAAELGYRPNSAARAVRQGRFDAIGLLQATSAGSAAVSYYTLLAIEQELWQRDLRLVMSMVPDVRLRAVGRLPQLLREWSVDGLIISYTFNVPGELAETLDRFEVPSVWLNCKRATDCVYPDDEGAAFAATRRLIELGHRDVAFAGFYVGVQHYSFADRRAGYERAMRSAGLSPRLYLPGEDAGAAVPPTDRIAAAARLWAGAGCKAASAVLTSGGADEATPFLIAARDAGNYRPALIGFNDGVMDQAGVEIATMRVPTFTMGVQATHAVLEKINRRGSEELPAGPMPPIVVPFVFTEGATCVPPAGSPA